MKESRSNQEEGLSVLNKTYVSGDKALLGLWTPPVWSQASDVEQMPLSLTTWVV